MLHKRYGRITFSAWLNLELSKSNLTVTVICGCLSAALCLAVGGLTRDPYVRILELGIGDLLPPLWLFGVMRFFALFTAGCGMGLALGRREPSAAVEKYRGGMFFLLMAAAELCWFPMLFGGGWVFFTALTSILMLCLAVCATVCILRVSPPGGWILIMHCVWLMYLLILSFAILFGA